MAKSKKSSGESKQQPAGDTISFNPLPSIQRIMDRFQLASVIQSAIYHGERDEQERKNMLETAKKVDEFVCDYATMQHWHEISKLWGKPHPTIFP